VATEPIPDRLAFSVSHAASQIDVSKRTFWEMIRQKKIRTVRCGRRVLVPRTELERFLRTAGSEGGTP